MLLHWAPAQHQKTDLDEMQVKGKVKTVTETEYRAAKKFGELQKEAMKDSIIYTFNSFGNILEKDLYVSQRENATAILITKDTYQYNEKGKVTQWDYFELDEKNIKGDLLHKKKKLYSYNQKDLLTEINYYGETNNLTERDIYKCDSKDNVSEVNDYNGDGSLSRKYTYSYDSKGGLSESKFYNQNEVLQITYRYDVKGNQVEAIDNDKSYNGSKSLAKYDEQGNRTEVIIYEGDGSIRQRTIITYDINGYEMEKISSFPSRKTLNPDRKSVKSYEYDKKMNWVKMYTSGEFNEIFVTERIIVYSEIK